MLNVSSDAKMKANLAHLKRLDAEIQDILQSGTHVTMYEFDPINTTWSRFDCEGPIFIVKRSSAPRFKMCILNRNSKVNLMKAVTSEFVVQTVDPYLIFKDTPEGGKTVIYGMWFPDDSEREKLHKTLKKCIDAERPLDNGDASVFGAQENTDQQQQQQQQTREGKLSPTPPTSSTYQASNSPVSSSPAHTEKDVGIGNPQSKKIYDPASLLTPSMILGEGKVPTFESENAAKLTPEDVKSAVIGLLDDNHLFVNQIYARCMTEKFM